MLRLGTHQGMNRPVVALCNGLIPAPDPKKQGVCHTVALPFI